VLTHLLVHNPLVHPQVDDLLVALVALVLDPLVYVLDVEVLAVFVEEGGGATLHVTW